jgi:hypothetical protein
MPFCQRFSGWFAFSGLNFAKIKWKTWKIAVLFGRDCAGLKVKGAENFPVASHKGKDSLENPRFAWLLTPGFNFLVKDFVFLRLLGRLAVP